MEIEGLKGLGIRNYVEDVAKNGPRAFNNTEVARLTWEFQKQTSYWAAHDNAIKTHNNVMSKREAPIFTHVHLKRYHGNSDNSYEIVMIMLKPEDIKLAELFDSFRYFSKYLKQGETILVHGQGGSWNSMISRDEILGTLKSEKLVVHRWDIEKRGIKTVQKLGII